MKMLIQRKQWNYVSLFCNPIATVIHRVYCGNNVRSTVQRHAFEWWKSCNPQEHFLNPLPYPCSHSLPLQGSFLDPWLSEHLRPLPQSNIWQTVLSLSFLLHKSPQTAPRRVLRKHGSEPQSQPCHSEGSWVSREHTETNTFA